MTVSIVRADLENVKTQVKALLDQLGYKPKKEEIFLKPNVVAPQPSETAVVTHIAVMEALLEYFAGRKIVIGEGSSCAQDTMTALTVAGYVDLAQRYHVELVDLGQVERQTVRWEYGNLKLPKLAFTHEYVNVPKMKTHVQTMVSLGMKNQKGLLANPTKKNFHIKHTLPEAIRALNQVVQPDLTVMDGILAIEGDGPGRAGRVKELGLLLAGQDVVEVDNAALQIMGFALGEVPHIPPRENVATVGLSLAEAKDPFLRAKDNYFNIGNASLFSMRACSGCLEAFAFGFIKSGIFRWTERVDVVAGIEARIPAEHGHLACFGKCTKKLAKTHKIVHIDGCPPQPEDVVKILEAFGL
jgi:uncharacterized protein (DUF362 family)